MAAMDCDKKQCVGCLQYTTTFNFGVPLCDTCTVVFRERCMLRDDVGTFFCEEPSNSDGDDYCPGCNFRRCLMYSANPANVKPAKQLPCGVPEIMWDDIEKLEARRIECRKCFEEEEKKNEDEVCLKKCTGCLKDTEETHYSVPACTPCAEMFKSRCLKPDNEVDYDCTGHSSAVDECCCENCCFRRCLGYGMDPTRRGRSPGRVNDTPEILLDDKEQLEARRTHFRDYFNQCDKKQCVGCLQYTTTFNFGVPLCDTCTVVFRERCMQRDDVGTFFCEEPSASDGDDYCPGCNFRRCLMYSANPANVKPAKQLPGGVPEIMWDDIEKLEARRIECRKCFEEEEKKEEGEPDARRQRIE